LDIFLAGLVAAVFVSGAGAGGGDDSFAAVLSACGGDGGGDDSDSDSDSGQTKLRSRLLRSSSSCFGASAAAGSIKKNGSLLL
jgi:hypothetical protein